MLGDPTHPVAMLTMDDIRRLMERKEPGACAGPPSPT